MQRRGRQPIECSRKILPQKRSEMLLSFFNFFNFLAKRKISKKGLSKTFKKCRKTVKKTRLKIHDVSTFYRGRHYQVKKTQ